MCPPTHFFLPACRGHPPHIFFLVQYCNFKIKENMSDIAISCFSIVNKYSKNTPLSTCLNGRILGEKEMKKCRWKM